jgi:uncharacterized protein (TIGR02246 family)
MKFESSRLRDFARRYTAAWCNRNAASVAAFYSPSGSLSVNGGAPAIGQDAISEIAQGFMTEFPDLEVVMDDVLAQGDNAVYHWTLSGTNTAPGGTGKRVCISGFEIWKIGADGLIAESQGHFGDTIYQHQLKHGIAKS